MAISSGWGRSAWAYDFCDTRSRTRHAVADTVHARRGEARRDMDRYMCVLVQVTECVYLCGSPER